jgi:hypothetical protein
MVTIPTSPPASAPTTAPAPRTFPGPGGPLAPTVAIVGATSLGLAIARAYPWVHVELYEFQWHEVDRARALIEAGELSGRVTVHHHAAAGVSVRRLQPAAPLAVA